MLIDPKDLVIPVTGFYDLKLLVPHAYFHVRDLMFEAESNAVVQYHEGKRVEQIDIDPFKQGGLSIWKSGFKIGAVFK